jgi:CRISPR-associated protein (TIGR02710 family)
LSEKETLPLITSNLTVPYVPKKFQEINDVEIIYFEYKKQIDALVKSGYEPSNIVADYTSGTKSMSAALLAASFAAGLGTVSYIYGTRDRGGRVISGTERPMAFAPARIFAYQKIAQAKISFNSNRFQSCVDICKEVEKMTSVPEILDEIFFIRTLATAYDAWDRFDFDTALEKFAQLKDSSFLTKYELKGKTEKHKEFLYREKRDKYSYDRVIDLIANANRRFDEEGRFDDGLARLYRAFEYLAQVKLYVDHNSLETKNIDLNKLPDHLKSKYAMKKKDNGRVELSLVGDYELLGDLGDGLGKMFNTDRNNDEQFKKALSKRNSSILAHGFQPITREAALTLLEYLKKYIGHVDSNYEARLALIRFPRLRK